LGEFSVYFVVSKLLILAYFSDTNLTDFLIKICWHFKMCKNLWISWIFKIYNIIILKVYRFAVIWKLPFLGLLLWCHLQDSGRGFQALGSVQHAAHAEWTVHLLASVS